MIYGYIRVSTDQQADSGAGLHAQKAAILLAFPDAVIVEDAGHSGKSLNRPGIKQILEAIEPGDALVCAKLDRLSRSVADLCEILDVSRRRGFRLVIMDVAVDTATPAGEMLVTIMAAVAQFERRMISSRTKDGLAAKRAQGVKLGRRNTHSWKATSAIVELREQGMSFGDIAKYMDKAYPLKGRSWAKSSLAEIVRRNG